MYMNKQITIEFYALSTSSSALGTSIQSNSDRPKLSASAPTARKPPHIAGRAERAALSRDTCAPRRRRTSASRHLMACRGAGARPGAEDGYVATFS
ncbi:hypothetical protein EVAR_31633_1 [Eumeta japonica]|uniref:Uncharacterized protein n=1 Tax=Eumeta variegata TaxID=151549 RepID=A0A4C1W113_EUMVA|nr:hypothetical protein EVAR_31633_1 [Eumeta japonica]